MPRTLCFQFITSVCVQSCVAATLEIEKLKLGEAEGGGQRPQSCKSLASDPSLCTREGTLFPCHPAFPDKLRTGGAPGVGLTQGWALQGRLAFSQRPHMCHLSHHRHHPLPGSPSPFCSGCTLDSWSFFRESLYLSARPPLSAPRGLGPWPSRHCSSGSYLATSITGPDYFLCSWGS